MLKMSEVAYKPADKLNKFSNTISDLPYQANLNEWVMYSQGRRSIQTGWINYTVQSYSTIYTIPANYVYLVTDIVYSSIQELGAGNFANLGITINGQNVMTTPLFLFFRHSSNNGHPIDLNHHFSNPLVLYPAEYLGLYGQSAAFTSGEGSLTIIGYLVPLNTFQKAIMR